MSAAPSHSGHKADPERPPMGAMTGREQMQQGAVLFDRFIGNGEHAWRDCEAERPDGLQIDDKLKLGWLQDWQVGRLGALENSARVNASLAATFNGGGRI